MYSSIIRIKTPGADDGQDIFLYVDVFQYNKD